MQMDGPEDIKFAFLTTFKKNIFQYGLYLTELMNIVI